MISYIKTHFNYHRKTGYAFVFYSVGIYEAVEYLFYNEPLDLFISITAIIIGTFFILQKDKSVRLNWNSTNQTVVITKAKKSLEFSLWEIKSLKATRDHDPKDNSDKWIWEKPEYGSEFVLIRIEFKKKTPFGKRVESTVYRNNKYDYEEYIKIKYAFAKDRSERAKRMVTRS